MTTNIDELYDMVNSFMEMIGEEPFPKLGETDDKTELKSLIDRYTERLRAKNPALRPLPDEILPDALLQPLRAAYAEMQ